MKIGKAGTLAAAAFAASALYGSAASATVYYLDYNVCAINCAVTNYGTITVSGGSDHTHVDVELMTSATDPTKTAYFVQAATPDDVAFNVLPADNVPVNVARVYNLSGNFLGGDPEVQHVRVQYPGLQFLYGVDWNTQNSAGLMSSVTFDLQRNSNAVTLVPTVVNGVNVYFSVDIQVWNGNQWVSGVIGATDAPPPPPPTTNAQGVPEPTVWALMLTGFFGAGSALRRRRDQRAV